MAHVYSVCMYACVRACLDARDGLVGLHDARRLGRVQVGHELRATQVVRPEQHALEQHCGRVGVAHVHCAHTASAHIRNCSQLGNCSHLNESMYCALEGKSRRGGEQQAEQSRGEAGRRQGRESREESEAERPGPRAGRGSSQTMGGRGTARKRAHEEQLS